jgi:glycosyltransferase involved in cell wall biosynthesis
MCWVIPTCTQFEAFNPTAEPYPRAELGIPPSAPVMGYVGSVGTFYLFEQVARAFALAQQRNPSTWLLVVSRHHHDYIRTQLTQAGANTQQAVIRGAAFRDVPRLVRVMDASVFFIKPSYSKQASAPTRLGELLGCGVPVVTNTGYGDVAEIIPDGPVGVLTQGFTDAELVKALDALQHLQGLAPREELAQRCFNTSQKYFSLEEGVRNYNSLYHVLFA